MRLREIIQIVDGTLLTPNSALDQEITQVSSSDLMSDVLAFSPPRALLITGLANSHVLRTCELAEISAIVFARGKAPTDPIVKLAEETNIPLICSPCSMFEACGRLWAAGLSSSTHPRI